MQYQDIHDKLIEKSIQGDRDAMSKLVNYYAPDVHRFIFSMLRDADATDDLAQDTFIRMVTNISSYEHRAPFKSWLFRIAVNVCRDHLRKKKVRRIVSRFAIDRDSGEEQEFADESPNPLRQVQSLEQRELIEKALQKLPASSRQVFVLREMQEFSYEEIAQALGWRLGTVKSRLFRARKELAELIGPQLEDES